MRSLPMKEIIILKDYACFPLFLPLNEDDITKLNQYAKSDNLRQLRCLHYAIVDVGTPPLTYLVALDTGSDLFWLPCDCTNCVRSLNSTSGKHTSSTGILVDDVLHLGTDQIHKALLRPQLRWGMCFVCSTGTVLWFDIFTADFSFRDEALMLFYHFRCGMIQTGDFLDAAAINGLFGLGMDNVSVPSILASKGLTANSFSMCFGPDGIGKIEFGDKGTPDQSVTPFNIEQPHPSYNVTVTQISVESNVTDLEFTAIFDSGTSATQTSYVVPNLNFTMKGGSQLSITAPTIVIPRQGGYAYCLAVVKSADINIIGQNFMTGYRMVFDHEEMVLSWTTSDCYDSVSSNNGSNTLPVNKGSPAGAPPPSVLEPEATLNRTRSAAVPSPPLPSPPSSTRPLFGNDAARINSMANSLLMVTLSIFLHQFFVLSS
ncbi:Aspartyl protease family protein 1 [Sesamum angolense]|uniref:Aspartyl protease family protein 1 n=1 Tax=Sesamum angolense TaxID=2727404 RepID=A0AAE1X783_9LAMI|nr:Aspartyl protease family protein 1 [Sesamum angolense]